MHFRTYCGRRGPLGTTEMAVALLEAGYHTTMGAKALRDAIGVTLRKKRGQFMQQGDKWRLPS